MKRVKYKKTHLAVIFNRERCFNLSSCRKLKVEIHKNSWKRDSQHMDFRFEYIVFATKKTESYFKKLIKKKRKKKPTTENQIFF